MRLDAKTLAARARMVARAKLEANSKLVADDLHALLSMVLQDGLKDTWLVNNLTRCASERATELGGVLQELADARREEWLCTAQ